jgi:hypothetical protein
MTNLFRRLQPAQKFHITITCIAQLLKIPKHLIVRVEYWAYVVFVHRWDQVDNSSVIGDCDNGRTPLPVRFKTAPPGNNCAHCGLLSKKITQSTKSSMTMSITNFYAKSGQNAGICFGTSNSHHR